MVCTYIGSGFFGCGSMLRCGYRTSWIVSLYNVVLSFRIDRCPIRSVSVEIAAYRIFWLLLMELAVAMVAKSNCSVHSLLAVCGWR